MPQPLLSVVIPAYNEQDCIDELARRLCAVTEQLAQRYTFEFIVVENGSADATFERLLALHARDARFKIVRLSRNFGIEGAVTAGLRYAGGNAAIVMCADLQDPPEMLPQFIAQWEAGYQNVYGVVEKRTDEGAVRQFFTRVFYWLINKLNDHPVPRNVSDFRLVDRQLYANINTMNERNRMLRSMWGWLGYKSIGITYERPPRFGGKSTYNLFRNIVFGLHGIASSTMMPLRLIPMCGVALSVLTILLLVGLAIRWVLHGVPFSGYGTIVTIVLLLFSLLFLMLGVLSEYIGIIYEEVRHRPLFIIEGTLGFKEST